MLDAWANRVPVPVPVPVAYWAIFVRYSVREFGFVAVVVMFSVLPVPLTIATVCTWLNAPSARCPRSSRARSGGFPYRRK